MKNRLICLAALILAAVLYLFENNTGTLTVLVGVLAAPALDLLPLGGKGAGAEISLDDTQQDGSERTGAITVTNHSFLPMPRLRITLSCRNCRTGERAETALELSLLPKQRKKAAFAFEGLLCGKIEIAVADARFSDVFGLFQRKLPWKVRESFTVLPNLFQPSISLGHSFLAMPDSDAYSPYKPGSDPGETFAIREYVPGDAVRSIHWKLSEKTDKTMVREFGLPIVNEVALLLENGGAASPEETDAVTQVFASLSAKLAGDGIAHHVFWQDAKTGDLRRFPVGDDDEFACMLDELLELPPKEGGSVARLFLEAYPHCPYSHVIIVGGRIPHGVGELYNGNRVSVLIPGREGIREGLQGDGTYMLSFGADSYPRDLCRMEV